MTRLFFLFLKEAVQQQKGDLQQSFEREEKKSPPDEFHSNFCLPFHLSLLKALATFPTAPSTTTLLTFTRYYYTNTQLFFIFFLFFFVNCTTTTRKKRARALSFEKNKKNLFIFKYLQVTFFGLTIITGSDWPKSIYSQRSPLSAGRDGRSGVAASFNQS